MGQTAGTKKYNAARKAQGQLNVEKWLRQKARRWSNAEIARRSGVAESTVSQALSRYYESHAAPNLEEIRASENALLDYRQRVAGDALERARRAKDSEALERADRSLQRIQERRARVNGSDIPVKVDPDLVVSTAATTAAATAAAVEARPAVPAIQIVLASDVGADEET